MQELLRAYLIVGDDELKREKTLERLKRYADGPFADFNLDERTDPAKVDPEDLISSVDTMPMGSDLRLVIIHDADKLPKETSEAIVEYLVDPNPQTTLALTAAKLAKTTRLRKAVAAQGEKAVIECSSLKRWQLAPYLEGVARKVHGITLAPGAADELIARSGESTVMLDTQLKTLADTLGAGAQVTRADVERLVSRTAEVKPWDLLDALSARNARKSIQLFALMPDSGYIALLSLIVGRIRELICARSLMDRGEQYQLASVLGKQDWQVKHHLSWAGGFMMPELEQVLGACARTERVLKGTGDNKFAMTQLILAICGR